MEGSIGGVIVDANREPSPLGFMRLRVYHFDVIVAFLELFGEITFSVFLHFSDETRCKVIKELLPFAVNDGDQVASMIAGEQVIHFDMHLHVLGNSEGEASVRLKHIGWINHCRS